MSNELQIRRWTPEDQVEVINLHVLGLQSTNAYAGHGPWDQDLGDIEGNYLKSEGEFLVGRVNERLVAMGAVQLSGPHGGEAVIRRMRVHPDFQRRGFGQTILDMLEAHAVKAGCRLIHLDTSVVQTAAQALYIKNGYREVGRQTTGGPLELILFEKPI